MPLKQRRQKDAGKFAPRWQGRGCRDLFSGQRWSANIMTGEGKGIEQKETCESSRLFGDFPYARYEEWRKAAEKSLKGASFEKKLISKTYDGFEVQPIYWQSDVEDLPHMGSLPGFPPFVRGSAALGYFLKPWEISQEFSYGDPVALNQAILHDLERGQTEFNFWLDYAGLAGLDADEAVSEDVGRAGVSISSLADLARVLEGIDLEKTPVYMQAGTMGLPVLALLSAYMRHQGKSTEKLRGCIGMDPLGLLIRTGVLPYSLKDAYDAMAWTTAWAREHAPLLQTVLVQGHPYHDAGGSAVQELAFAAATAVEYLGEMQARGMHVDDVAARMRFSFSSGSDFFLEIAKLRAARLIWSQIAGAFGGSEKAQKMYMHVSTSNWNKTIYDPYVNILRTTTEAFAGVIGGADSINIGAFDRAIRPSDDFSRRIARNIHFILNDEVNLTIPVDPSGGSYYVEKMTDSLARKAWSLFQEVEAKGGMSKALQEGFPQEQAAQTAAKRKANIARRKDIFVGTNMYPNTIEKPLADNPVDYKTMKREQSKLLAGYRASIDKAALQEALNALVEAKAQGGGVVEAAVKAALSGATLGTLACAVQTEGAVVPSISAINIHRGAEIFEFLRKTSEAYRDKTGSPPRVFLANMGPIPQHKPRADFTTGFFETGGFKVLKNDGFPTVEEAAGAFADSGASIAVICSTDDTYSELVPPLTKLIKDARPDTTVLLAGYPADLVETFRQAGGD
ncbi:MAG TPA: methylmalonyl-CoA mutase, partial [Pelotomaculum sp.]|nr:methylmalonyl-CoA mutase [Pelotomaculum sp.]